MSTPHTDPPSGGHGPTSHGTDPAATPIEPVYDSSEWRKKNGWTLELLNHKKSIPRSDLKEVSWPSNVAYVQAAHKKTVGQGHTGLNLERNQDIPSHECDRGLADWRRLWE